MTRLRRSDRVVLALAGTIALLTLATAGFTSSVWNGRAAEPPPAGQVAVDTGDGQPPGFTTGGDAHDDPYWSTAEGELIVRDRDGERLGTVSCGFVPDEDRDTHPCPPPTSVTSTAGR